MFEPVTRRSDGDPRTDEEIAQLRDFERLGLPQRPNASGCRRLIHIRTVT
jgi:hypothetical protein